MEEPVPDPKCEVCGRRLLPGERANNYLTRDGTEAIVCELCKPRAEAAGWLRPEDLATISAGGSGRSRRKPRGRLLADLRARGEQLRRRGQGEPDELDPDASEAETQSGPAPAATASAPTPPPARRNPPREQHKPAAEQRRAMPAVDLNTALAAFNASEFRRTVGGLNRSLGQPRSSGLAVRLNTGASGARITVAWELAWYQWEIGPGKRGAAIRQSGKGETVDQLRAADRTWNLEVASDGALARKRPTSERPATPAPDSAAEPPSQ